jgi:hypothetical protein
MPLESQKEEIKQSKEHHEEAYIDRTISEASQQINLNEKPEQFTIMIPESHEHKAGEIGKVLGLSFSVTLNSAVKYALFYAQNKGVYLKELEEYPKSLSSHSLRLKVTAETWQRLKELEMTEQISECVFTGIELLYKQLIDIKIKV